MLNGERNKLCDICYLAEDMLVTIESDQRICTNCLTLVEKIVIAPLQTVLVDAWVSVPEERLMLRPTDIQVLAILSRKEQFLSWQLF